MDVYLRARDDGSTDLQLELRSDHTPAVVLVRGAFAESASWYPVIEMLHARDVEVVAAANPLRSVSGDAAYVRDVVAGLDRPVLLVGHSYAGVVITEAASADPAVLGLVYVAAFAPDHGESALELSTTYPGSSLGESLPPCATKPLGRRPAASPS